MNRKISPPRYTMLRVLVIAGSTVAVAVVLGLVLISRSISTPAPEQAATAPHFVDTTQADHHASGAGRTVVIARLGEAVPGISGATGPLMTTLVRGTYPEGVTQATVRTDENCAPDQDGVSHCLNELDFGTTTVVVQHHHAMAKTPCLTPGETVAVMTVAQYNADL